MKWLGEVYRFWQGMSYKPDSGHIFTLQKKKKKKKNKRIFNVLMHACLMCSMAYATPYGKTYGEVI